MGSEVPLCMQYMRRQKITVDIEQMHVQFVKVSLEIRQATRLDN